MLHRTANIGSYLPLLFPSKGPTPGSKRDEVLEYCQRPHREGSFSLLSYPSSPLPFHHWVHFPQIISCTHGPSSTSAYVTSVYISTHSHREWRMHNLSSRECTTHCLDQRSQGNKSRSLSTSSHSSSHKVFPLSAQNMPPECPSTTHTMTICLQASLVSSMLLFLTGPSDSSLTAPNASSTLLWSEHVISVLLWVKLCRVLADLRWTRSFAWCQRSFMDHTTIYTTMTIITTATTTTTNTPAPIASTYPQFSLGQLASMAAFSLSPLFEVPYSTPIPFI